MIRYIHFRISTLTTVWRIDYGSKSGSKETLLNYCSSQIVVYETKVVSVALFGIYFKGRYTRIF